MKLRSRKWLSSFIFFVPLLFAGHATPVHAQAELSSEYSLPLFMPASNRVQQGFVRIINHSDHAGTVRIHAIDDSGQRFGPVTLEIAGKASIHLNSSDLESGSADKGLSGGVGDGEGNWRLELDTTLDIEPLAYIRTADGFLTSMHDLVAESGLKSYHVAFFNPASNLSKVSRLRLINPTDTEASVQIVGLDDGGETSEGTVRLTLPAGGARIITAKDLESGASGLTGRLGDGTGKWQLTVSADHPIQLVNLLRSETGHLANLSNSSIKRFAPTDQAAFGGIFVGRRVLTGDQGDYIDFISSGRFNALEDGEAYAGRYTYERTGLTSGRLVLSFDGGSCEVSLTYVSATTGVYSSVCSDGTAGADRWTLAEVPTTGGPDLVVRSPTVSDSTPNAGASFTLRATVRNSGAARSAATTLRYYRSSDATISTSDTAVGTDAVNALAASSTSAESISLTAPSSGGTYYYGACVDTVTGESDTTNNCSDGARISVSGGGNTFTVGDALPGVPTSGLFIPADTSGASVSSSGGNTTITFSNGGYIELQNGTRYTCQAAGGCQVRNGVVTRGTIVGGGGTPPPSNAPDLVVQSASVSDSSPSAGQSFTLRATVRNSGAARSAATTLRYYRSSDATISTSDTAVGTDAVGALAASGTSAESVSLTAPSSAGTYYYGACVDTVSGESNTRNNCSTGVRVVVQGSSDKAVVGTITECSGTRTSFLAVDVTIRGTIQAIRSVTALRITGNANGQFIDSEFVGTMSSGRSRNFNLSGTLLDSSATRVNCSVDLDWLERRSQGAEVRGKSSMHGPSQGMN